ncbi:MAG TPA: TIGR00725 family protein [Longimicrobiales bacterium]|nr:TIGR00725 family protein [Longimicrobiales bacterium]
MAVERPLRVAVCGAESAPPEMLAAAEEVGRLLAEAGAVVICGGRGGVMEAVARGAAGAGGLTVGILPGRTASEANPYISIPLPTGMGEGRNVLVVRSADAVIAIGGEWGTLSEIALARKMGIPVVLLHPTLARGLDVPVADGPKAAVDFALGVRAR